jgi:hypothetical protein
MYMQNASEYVVILGTPPTLRPRTLHLVMAPIFTYHRTDFGNLFVFFVKSEPKLRMK